MKIRLPSVHYFLALITMFGLFFGTSNQEVVAKEIKIAFWNVENLFDEHVNPLTKHEEVLEGEEVALKLKLDAEVIGKLDADIIGLSEVENLSLLRRMVKEHLAEKGYRYLSLIKGESSRGINVAIISRYPCLVRSVDVPDFYRDLLAARFSIEGQPFYVVVNHWKSRRNGGEEMRMFCAKAAAKFVKEEIKLHEGKEIPVTLIGDFNDDPEDPSVKHLANQGMINTMLEIEKEKRWTLGFYKKADKKMLLNSFDQVIINSAMKTGSRISWKKTEVFRPKFLINPNRVYNGIKYPLPLDDYRDRIGYSDHFPVIATFELKPN